MATKTFAINTKPHVADVGGTELLFQPEVMGDDFMDAYAELRNKQQNSGVDLDDLQGTDPAQLRVAARALRTFLAELMLTESAELFTRLDVVRDGKALKSFSDRDEAEKYAEDNLGSRVVDALRLPDRVLVELLEWAVELFGGGQAPSYVIWRLCEQIAVGWDAWDGSLALHGADPHTWTLRRLLNAAEAAMDATAEDDAERQRNRAMLYAPPGGRSRAPDGRRVRPPGMEMDMRRAQALTAQLSAEDARLTGGATG